MWSAWLRLVPPKVSRKLIGHRDVGRCRRTTSAMARRSSTPYSRTPSGSAGTRPRRRRPRRPRRSPRPRAAGRSRRGGSRRCRPRRWSPCSRRCACPDRSSGPPRRPRRTRCRRGGPPRRARSASPREGSRRWVGSPWSEHGTARAPVCPSGHDADGLRGEAREDLGDRDPEAPGHDLGQHAAVVGGDEQVGVEGVRRGPGQEP